MSFKDILVDIGCAVVLIGGFALKGFADYLDELDEDEDEDEDDDDEEDYWY